MLIKLFDVQDKKVVASETTYMVPELALVISTFKENYLKVLYYIFCTTCPDGTNPYANVDEELKEQVILADQKPEFDLEDPIIIRAQEKCLKLYETPTLRAYIAAKKGVDKIAKWVNETEITSGKDGNGMLYNTYMSKIADYNKQYKDLEKELMEEQAKVRGSQKLRYDQQPNYKNLKDDKDE
jgi:hypothetical protein